MLQTKAPKILSYHWLFSVKRRGRCRFHHFSVFSKERTETKSSRQNVGDDNTCVLASPLCLLITQTHDRQPHRGLFQGRRGTRSRVALLDRGPSETKARRHRRRIVLPLDPLSQEQTNRRAPRRGADGEGGQREDNAGGNRGEKTESEVVWRNEPGVGKSESTWGRRTRNPHAALSEDDKNKLNSDINKLLPVAFIWKSRTFPWLPEPDQWHVAHFAFF